MNKNIFVSTAAAILFSTEVMADATKPVFPGYSSCPVVNSTVDANCVSAINKKYESDLYTYNRSINLITDTYTGQTPPKAPIYNCSNDANGSANAMCEKVYADLTKTYNSQVEAYNALQRQKLETYQAQQTAMQSKTAEAAGSVTQNLAAATETNKKGSAIYKIAAIGCTGASIYYAIEFAKSCSGGATCVYPFLAKSAAFAVGAAIATQQASSHDESAYASCQAQNQISSANVNCGPVPVTPIPDEKPIVSIIDQIDPVTGKCKPTASASCNTIVKDLEQKGVDIKTLAKDKSFFAGSNSPFKVNKDGSVTTKDGKTYKPSDFADEKSMIAAGFSASDAKDIMSKMRGPNGMLAGIDAKAELKETPKFDFGSFGGSGSGSVNIKLGEDEANKAGLGTIDGSLGKRKPTSEGEGLVRSFNGDSIGISNDDIFKMMNKRYKLKSAQDSFLGQ